MSWTTATLGDVATWGSGGTPSRSRAEYFGTGTPWLSISDLNDGLVVHAKESLTALGIENSSAKVVPAGTLFVAMYGSIGKLGVAGREMCTSQAIAFARPRPEYVDARYLFHYLLSQRRALEARGRGGTQRNIGQGDLKAWPIPLPSLQEQRRIAAILDQADALRAKRRRSLALLDDLIQSALAATFGDLWTGSTTIGDTAVIQGGLQVTRTRAALSLTAPYLRVANVHRGRLQLDEIKTIGLSEAELARTRLQADDLLFVEGHANPLEVGRVARWDGSIEDCTHQNHLIRARLDQTRCLPIYACHWLNSPKGAAHFRRGGKTTSGLNTISASTVRSAPLPLPPLHLQRTFAARTEHIDLQRARAMRSLEVLDELFASLQSRAFSGELTLSAS